MLRLSKFFLLLLLFSFSLGCTNSDPVCTDVEYDTPFTIEKGGNYCFPDGNYFEVTSLLNAFCPCNAECIWGGEMLIYYIAEFDGESVISFFGSSGKTTGLEFVSEHYNLLVQDIEFEKDCDENHPNPKIANATVTVIQAD